MLSIQVSVLVNQLVRHMLQGKGRDNEALYFHLDCRISHHVDGKEYSESRGLHLMYQVNAGYSYINVFAAITSSPFDKFDKVQKWEHISTHDTCWRDIRTFSEVYFDMAACINKALKADGLSEIAPKDMHEWSGFGMADELFQWVPVKVSKDPNCDRNYTRVLEVIHGTR